MSTSIPPVDLTQLPADELRAMQAADEEIAECYRVLRKVNLNVVGEILKGQGQFIRLNHYPQGDVYDSDTHAQYYYHAHRDGEHGHFHCFLRAAGMPPGAAPVPEAAGRDWPQGDQALSHLIAVSMDRNGYPIGLFTTNRWVTAETWYPAEDVIRMLPRFAVDHAWPSWPTNRWLSAMLRLFRPQIEALVRARDAALAERRAAYPDRDVYEDRDFETLSETSIDVDAQMQAIRKALNV
ncbi:DUF6969 family protein [Alkalilacustris brevis]|uniref:DUF6969 family protein n=1 Tax=Alkalilacustris brevis TaxID=2026338 RepID=UPI000E0D9900|nr:hypothetical protein [Alkalilacustris brevis]